MFNQISLPPSRSYTNFTSQEYDPFLQAAKRTPVDLEAWAVSMMERHNRKSHLAPQLSPATKSFLQIVDKGSPSSRTPTSGDIPITTSVNGISSTRSPRPSYPARTSSAGQVPGAAGHSGSNTMNLPIRPAPPLGATPPRASRRVDMAAPPPSKSAEPLRADPRAEQEYARQRQAAGSRGSAYPESIATRSTHSSGGESNSSSSSRLYTDKEKYDAGRYYDRF